MTFALTAFRANGIDLAGPTRKRGLQRMVFEFTAAASNVAVSLGNFSGTFWTDVVASAMGTAVKDTVQNRIQPQVATLLRVGSPQLLDRVQIATVAAAGQYQLALQNDLPNLTLNSGDGETTWVIETIHELDDGAIPVFAEYQA